VNIHLVHPPNFTFQTKKGKKHTLRVSNDHLLCPAAKAGAGATAAACAGGDGGAVANTGVEAGAV
jgi:hypothetical protein